MTVIAYTAKKVELQKLVSLKFLAVIFEKLHKNSPVKFVSG